MALLWLDGFDTYYQPGDRYSTSAGTGSISSTFARNGINGFEAAFSSATATFTSRATYIVGFAFKQLNNNATTFFEFSDTGTTQCRLSVDSAGFLFFGDNGNNVIGSKATNPIVFSNWNYIEALVTINNTTGVAQMRVNGVLVLNLSGVNTRNGGTANNTANQLSMLASININNAYDDYYVCDNSGSAPWNTFLGDLYVQGLVPTANGTLNNFSQGNSGWIASTTVGLGTQIVDSNGAIQKCTTANGTNLHGTTGSGSHPVWATTVGLTTTDNNLTWTLIQKPTLSDFNFVNSVLLSGYNLPSVYMSDSNVNDQERFLMAAGVAGTTVYGVGVNVNAEKDNTGARSYRTVVDSGGTLVDNGSDHALTQNFATVQDLYVTDPNTSAQWTPGGVNAAEFGVKLTV